MLELKPCDFGTAQEFVRTYHRHKKPPIGYKFAIACYSEGKLCGVVIVGRPVGRYLDDGLSLEVTRCCTDGTHNACSKLYGAACRAAQALGYKRIFTYTRVSEHGASLRASNWICDGQAGGTHWTGQRYEQTEHHKDAALDALLKRQGQREAMRHYGWSEDEFRARFGKNYI